MKLSEVFPSKWLKGDDLGENQPVVTIEDVTLEEFDNTKRGGKIDKKVALHFAGKDKGMICNKGMQKIVEGFFGDDTDDWIGKKIRIMAVPYTSEDGTTTMVCRIHPKQPSAPAPQPPKAPTAPAPDVAPDDIPF